MHNGLPLEVVLIGFVVFFAAAAFAIKAWEEYERKKTQAELNADNS